jgi:hypothetical protein
MSSPKTAHKTQMETVVLDTGRWNFNNKIKMKFNYKRYVKAMVRFEVFNVVKREFVVFWVVASCNVADGSEMLASNYMTTVKQPRIPQTLWKAKIK